MRVRLTTDRHCMVRGWQWQGEVHDLPEDEARRLLAAGQAEAIEAQADEPEEAETAAPRRPRRK